MYSILFRILNVYHVLKTRLWYAIFLKKAGKGCCIRNPILITPSCISLGDRVFIRDHARLEGVFTYEFTKYRPQIFIGNNVSIEQNIHLTCANNVRIGSGTAIAANVTITDIIHLYSDITISPERQQLKVRDVHIGNDCKLYNNVVILPGTRLGKHTVVAANSVVMGAHYPDFVVLAGNPARVVRQYDKALETWITVRKEK